MEYFYYFVVEVVDDFDGNVVGFGLGEGMGYVVVEIVLGFFVDFGFECCFEVFVWIVGVEEVGLVNEEVFFVVVGVDELICDVVGFVVVDFVGVGLEDVDVVDLDFDVVEFCIFCVGFVNGDVWFVEDYE